MPRIMRVFKALVYKLLHEENEPHFICKWWLIAQKRLCDLFLSDLLAKNEINITSWIPMLEIDLNLRFKRKAVQNDLKIILRNDPSIQYVYGITYLTDLARNNGRKVVFDETIAKKSIVKETIFEEMDKLFNQFIMIKKIYKLPVECTTKEAIRQSWDTENSVFKDFLYYCEHLNHEWVFKPGFALWTRETKALMRLKFDIQDIWLVVMSREQVLMMH